MRSGARLAVRWPTDDEFRDEPRRDGVRYTVSDFPAKGNQLTSKQIVELSQLTEQVGIDRFSITDFPFHQDCIPLMTACLVGTERLEVESLVTTPFLRMPDVTACTWATM